MKYYYLMILKEGKYELVFKSYKAMDQLLNVQGEVGSTICLLDCKELKKLESGPYGF